MLFLLLLGYLVSFSYVLHRILARRVVPGQPYGFFIFFVYPLDPLGGLINRVAFGFVFTAVEQAVYHGIRQTGPTLEQHSTWFEFQTLIDFGVRRFLRFSCIFFASLFYFLSLHSFVVWLSCVYGARGYLGCVESDR